MQVRKQQLELDMEQQTGSKSGKEYINTVTLLFNLYAEYIMRNAGLEETQAGIKIAGRNITNLRYADDTTLMAESEEELKSLGITINCGKFWKRWEYQTTWPASWKICMQVRKQQLELDMEQQTGSK